jgi:hypothetical protein
MYCFQKLFAVVSYFSVANLGFKSKEIHYFIYRLTFETKYELMRSKRMAIGQPYQGIKA